MHAFEVESVEQQGSDYIYDIKITPDRGPYAYGLRYVALELCLIIPGLKMSEYLRTDLTDEDVTYTQTELKHDLVNKFLENLCPIYSLTKIENVKNGASPEWLKQRLASIGQNPKSLLVDLTNYIMFDIGQPLHVFDADKVYGHIRVDFSVEGESITLLGGKEIQLDANTLVIRDSKDILAIPGVKGGAKAEVDEHTTNVYLEAAHFNQAAVRKVARKLNLMNESSKRFEQGINPQRFLLAVQDYIHVLQSVAPDVVVHKTEISHDLNGIYNQNLRRRIDIDIDSLTSTIDSNNDQIPTLLVDFIEQVLPKTGAEIIHKGDGTYTLVAPYHRTDMIQEADIADEFLRNKSYDILRYDEGFKNLLHKATDLGNDADKLTHNVRKFFKDRDFDEVILHTLVDSKVNANATKLKNSLTADRDSLRSDLKTNILKSVELNFKHLDLVSKNIIKVFEIGKVFKNEGNDVTERNHLAFALAMVKWPKGVQMEDEMEKIITELGLGKIKTETVNNVIIAEIDLDAVDAGQVVQEKIESYLSDTALIRSKKYTKASAYPAMSRDIAFFVEDSAGKNETDIDALIKDLVSKNPIIENYFRFDIFQKDGKTSYAYRFVFQSYEKTLTEEETKDVMGNMAENLVEQGFIVR